MVHSKSPKPADTATTTVKLDAAALRKLVVSTVVTVEDDGAEEAAEDGDDPAVADKPRAP